MHKWTKNAMKDRKTNTKRKNSLPKGEMQYVLNCGQREEKFDIFVLFWKQLVSIIYQGVQELPPTVFYLLRRDSRSNGKVFRGYLRAPFAPMMMLNVLKP